MQGGVQLDATRRGVRLSSEHAPLALTSLGHSVGQATRIGCCLLLEALVGRRARPRSRVGALCVR